MLMQSPQQRQQQQQPHQHKQPISQFKRTISSKSPMLMQTPQQCHQQHQQPLTDHFIEVADVDAKSPSLAFLPRLHLHQVVPQVHLRSIVRSRNYHCE